MVVESVAAGWVSWVEQDDKSNLFTIKRDRAAHVNTPFRTLDKLRATDRSN